ncbi:MAG: polysaccharide deacetylase family protein [Bacillota bacterium]|nr:polysaccharide deacetylase family protein [Bacillota bacterium]
MSLLTKGIGLVKKIKHRYDAQIKARTPVYLSPVRRIERVKTREKVLAMTFDDGPSAMLPHPQGSHTEGLTVTLMHILDSYGAKGTFDIIGSTANSYPDRPGKEGSASWGGEKFDHYPDIFQDDKGGAVACPEIIEMLIRGGHEITSHTFEHILYGKKSLVYGGRSYLGDYRKVLADLERLHTHMKEKHGYEMRLSRPPHYVDAIQKGISSYDAYAHMGYQYMAASFDGAGWLPLATYEQEVEAMWKPIAHALKQDANYFCGQIIFQKDGFNMARRTPVADGLPIQLKLLTEAGYRVVTVSELLSYSPFADLGEGDRHYEAAKKLDRHGFCVAYRDNTVRVNGQMTIGELCMTFFGKATAQSRVERILQNKGERFTLPIDAFHPYADAVAFAVERDCLSAADAVNHARIVTPENLIRFCEKSFVQSIDKMILQGNINTRGQVLEYIAAMIHE